MTTLYKPVLIETAEQADALPASTPIIIGPFIAMSSDADGFWGMSFTSADYTSAELVKSFPDYDLTALVPIDVEVEYIRETGIRRREKTLYVTPWSPLTPDLGDEAEALADCGDEA